MRHAVAAALALVACGSPADPPPEPEVCDEGSQSASLTPVDRRIIGDAAAYPADGELRARDAQLATSQRERREVAWATVAKVLDGIPLDEPLPSLHGAAELPRFSTWYDLDDVRRVFHRAYGALTTAEKEARTPISTSALDQAFGWNVTSVDELPNWPRERYLAYVDAIEDASEVAGLGGLSRVVYSPAAARHMVASYPDVLACRDSGPPPAQDVGPSEEVELARVPVDVESCSATAVGSFAVLADETLRAVLEEGEGGVLRAVAGEQSCRAAAGEVCEIEGPATVMVAAEAGSEPLSSVVAITVESRHPKWAGCLAAPFPLDAAIVKADYRRADLELQLPAYVTTASALTARLAGDASWEVPDAMADPSPAQIHTLTLPNGLHFRLAGLHVMTKELDHWVWITLWWSPEPDDDFGADRPASIAALGGPWGHYKMCVVTAFEEGDREPGGGFEETHPTLAAALAAVHSGQGAPTWCSNPYLEEGHGNAATNCIGCHQHGGTGLPSEQILTFPERGRTSLRNNFPTDYSWAIDAGDRLGQLFADEELYWLGPR
ncbi:MAG: hypothetical protein IPG04_31935 [Polyangiaceae bacterium]|nr:hypothetical protein [Polyangiaceae bacterium]